MQYTEHNKLNLPELVDQYNLKHWNENTTKIDEKLNEHQVKLDASTPETTPSSLMMRNEQGKVKVTTPLEQDDTNMAVNIDYLINVFRTKMLDEAHPKGEIYYTEDKNFDPNISWVGTWVRIKERFIWAMGDDDGNVGDTGGSQSGSFTIGYNNLPEHQHYFSASHSHSLWGSNAGVPANAVGVGCNTFENINGVAAEFNSNRYSQGWYSEIPYTRQSYVSSTTVSGRTSYTSSWNNTKTPNNDAITYNKMPPYEKAYCWKRTE